MALDWGSPRFYGFIVWTSIIGGSVTQNEDFLQLHKGMVSLPDWVRYCWSRMWDHIWKLGKDSLMPCTVVPCISPVQVLLPLASQFCFHLSWLKHPARAHFENPRDYVNQGKLYRHNPYVPWFPWLSCEATNHEKPVDVGCRRLAWYVTKCHPERAKVRWYVSQFGSVFACICAILCLCGCTGVWILVYSCASTCFILGHIVWSLWVLEGTLWTLLSSELSR